MWMRGGRGMRDWWEGGEEIGKSAPAYLVYKVF
jgi:hypothetical protein